MDQNSIVTEISDRVLYNNDCVWFGQQHTTSGREGEASLREGEKEGGKEGRREGGGREGGREGEREGGRERECVCVCVCVCVRERERDLAITDVSVTTNIALLNELNLISISSRYMETHHRRKTPGLRITSLLSLIAM